MQFRNGVAADIGAIQAIERASAVRFLDVDMPEIASGDPTSETILLQRIAQGHLFVAIEGLPVGFVFYDVVDDHLYIEEINVYPSHGGKRLGAGLIHLVEDRARDEGLPGLLLSTFRDVPWNGPYYRRLGFTDIADTDLSPALLHIRQEHIARGLDETMRVFMRKPVKLDSHGDPR
ncbi:GNAT family N-acetyltransferase [Phyllobacterium sp. 628]|uniref:GNAT family N-acetyltransferase n=1 Tax=Phyllobacterium sp. 628 TaxID=2718938 RepID=UPI0016625CA6|nr:GNAT family N-acetyltransferase [Phyllobacterium sp. 628]QND51131.1 GNAT family N-acetyltransferase [Phyllobacterium sp. 628]